jgi:hypothetical protein
MNNLENAYKTDQSTYVGPRTQYDLELQKQWCPTCSSSSCASSVENDVIYSNSMPITYDSMRTQYDLDMKTNFNPGDARCNTMSSRAVIYSTSTPEAYAPMRTQYDLDMKSMFNPNDSMSCMNSYQNTKENFSYGLSFNDQNNIWSYTGDMNCAATCSLNCAPYPSVTNCSGSFDIVKGAGCSDGCNNGYNNSLAPTCSNYIYNPYQDTTCGCKRSCGSGC